MPHWRNSIQKATWRGLRINVDTTSMEFGRRVTMHELPFKDAPYSEDVGRKGRVFSFSGFIDADTVPGHDYIDHRNEVINSIENDDSIGTLVLPTLGTRQVRPMGCKVTFSNKVGGKETLELSFVEADKVIALSTFTINSPEDTKIKAVLVEETVKDEAGGSMDFFLEQADSTERIVDPDVLIDETVQIPNRFIEGIKLALETGQQLTDEANEFTRTLEDYENNLRKSLSVPSDFFNDTSDLFAVMSTIWPSSTLADAYTAFNDIFNTAVDEFGKVVNIFTPGRDQQDKNNQSTTDGFRNIVLGQMANATVFQEYISSNQIQVRRESILLAFDQQIENAGNAFDLTQRDALINLRSSTLNHLDSEVGSLPDEVDFSVGDAIPVWVLANDLYGDAFRGEEIVDSNDILNPNFVTGQTVIKVLAS